MSSAKTAIIRRLRKQWLEFARWPFRLLMLTIAIYEGGIVIFQRIPIFIVLMSLTLALLAINWRDDI